MTLSNKAKEVFKESSTFKAFDIENLFSSLNPKDVAQIVADLLHNNKIKLVEISEIVHTPETCLN